MVYSSILAYFRLACGFPLDSTMASASRPLFELQELDTKIEAARGALERVVRELRGDPRVEAARKRTSALEASLADAQGEFRALEAQSSDLSNAIKRHNATLYGGKIQDARELKSIEAEIRHATDRRSHLEDEEIRLMEAIDGLEVELANAGAAVDQVTADRAGALEHLRQDQASIEHELERFETEKERLWGSIDQSKLTLYERLRAGHGHAVSHVQNGVCQWCRVQLPSGDVQHARGTTIVTCTNCSRILYAD